MQRSPNENPLRYLFAKTWQYSAEHRSNIVWYWIMFIVANAIILFFPPLIMAKIFNMMQTEGVTAANIKKLMILLGATLALDIIFWSLHGPARVIERMNAFDVRATYQKYLVRGTLALPMDWHAGHHSGGTNDKISKGTNGLFQFSENSFEIIASFVQLTVSYGMIAYFSRLAAALVLVMIVLTIWIITRFDRVLIAQYHELNHAENEIAEGVLDAISNITTVIVLRVERLVFEAIAKRIDVPRELFARNNRLNEIKWFITNMCCNVMTCLVLGSYFLRNLGAAPGVLFTSVVLLWRYLEKISDLFYQFARMYSNVVLRRTGVANAEELTADFKVEGLANHVLPPHWQTLTVRDLHFSYDNDGERLHLEGIAIAFTRGERIALIGETGSGKSTLLKVMGGLYEPQRMTLMVDGAIIPEQFRGICRAITLIPQESAAFTTTIRRNITMGADYDAEAMQHAIDMACFTDVIRNLPNGLESSIKERGVNLSGGQQQRLALARGFLAGRDKDIILLDEPTSSVDVVNEARIFKNIFREFAGKTVITATHNLYLLPSFDRIYLFDSGKIIASGSFGELQISSPEFQKLWQQYREHEFRNASERSAS